MFNDDIAKATLKQVANVSVAPIRVSRKATLEPCHEFRQVAVRRSDNQVKVILHLTTCEDVDSMSLFFFNQNLEKPPAIANVLENPQPTVAAIHDVVGVPSDQRALLAAHACRLIQSSYQRAAREIRP